MLGRTHSTLLFIKFNNVFEMKILMTHKENKLKQEILI